MTYGDRRMLWKLGCASLLLNACGGSPDATTAMEMDEQTAEACKQDGVICTYMGNGIAGLGHDGQAPLEVSLYLPQDLAIAEDGTPYVLDWNNHRVRTLKDGMVETVIGTGELGDGSDGPAREVSLSARRRSYAPRLTKASRPRRTVSVSVVAPHAVLASRKRLSSMCRVFFIQMLMP